MKPRACAPPHRHRWENVPEGHEAATASAGPAGHAMHAGWWKIHLTPKATLTLTPSHSRRVSGPEVKSQGAATPAWDVPRPRRHRITNITLDGPPHLEQNFGRVGIQSTCWQQTAAATGPIGLDELCFMGLIGT